MIKVGVIGTGYMGSLHARVYSELESVEFVGIFDKDFARAKELSSKYNVEAFASYKDLILNVDALTIATPTILHYEHAKECIAAKKHALIEKPFAVNVFEAQDIIALSEKNGTIIAVGYIERFNPTVIKLIDLVKDKKLVSIKTERIAPPAERANDVSAVFDLMIHDIDIILEITHSLPANITAAGKKINSEVFNEVYSDMIMKNGIKAELFSTKVADKKSRVIKIVCEDAIFEADLISKIISVKESTGEINIQCTGGEPIKEEIKDFINAIKGKKNPRVSGRDALLSLKTAFDIESACSISK